jgi:hypothetical protein
MERLGTSCLRPHGLGDAHGMAPMQGCREVKTTEIEDLYDLVIGQGCTVRRSGNVEGGGGKELEAVLDVADSVCVRRDALPI